MKITNHLEAVKKVFIDYPKLYEVKQEELKKVGSERQDLLHALELGKLDAIQMSKIVRDLRKVQIKRRKIKNELEILDEIKRFVNQYERKQISVKDINRLIDRVEYIARRERSYLMRVRTDLQHFVEVEE